MTVNVSAIVEGATYQHVNSGDRFILLGRKRRTVILNFVVTPEGRSPLATGPAWMELALDDFLSEFEDTGIHNHADFCCTVHKTHASGIHRGCVLR